MIPRNVCTGEMGWLVGVSGKQGGHVLQFWNWKSFSPNQNLKKKTQTTTNQKKKKEANIIFL